MCRKESNIRVVNEIDIVKRAVFSSLIQCLSLHPELTVILNSLVIISFHSLFYHAYMTH